jgi:hypothetical protein
MSYYVTLLNEICILIPLFIYKHPQHLELFYSLNLTGLQTHYTDVATTPDAVAATKIINETLFKIPVKFVSVNGYTMF